MRAGPSSAATSATTASTCAPWARASSTLSSRLPASRSARRRRAPSRANVIAVARPLPIVSPAVCPAPTTIATRSSSRPTAAPFVIGPYDRRLVATAEVRARFGALADEIEAEMRHLGTWSEDPPSEETVLEGGAFGLGTVAFDTWLQVVF